jgi:hypothetical protein
LAPSFLVALLVSDLALERVVPRSLPDRTDPPLTEPSFFFFVKPNIAPAPTAALAALAPRAAEWRGGREISRNASNGRNVRIKKTDDCHQRGADSCVSMKKRRAERVSTGRTSTLLF